MEYQLSGSLIYTAITGTEIINLTPGTYLVRYKADGSNPTGPPVTVIVPEYVPADQYGLVTAFTPANLFDNPKVRLLTSDGTADTYYLSDNLDVSVSKGQIIAYGLNEDGEISTMNSSDEAISVASGLNILSPPALSYGGITYDMSDHVVIFTYDGTDPDTANAYGIANIANTAGKSFTLPSRVLIKNSKVAVLLVSASDL